MPTSSSVPQRHVSFSERLPHSPLRALARPPVAPPVHSRPHISLPAEPAACDGDERNGNGSSDGLEGSMDWVLSPTPTRPLVSLLAQQSSPSIVIVSSDDHHLQQQQQQQRQRPAQNDGMGGSRQQAGGALPGADWSVSSIATSHSGGGIALQPVPRAAARTSFTVSRDSGHSSERTVSETLTHISVAPLPVPPQAGSLEHELAPSEQSAASTTLLSLFTVSRASRPDCGLSMSSRAAPTISTAETNLSTFTLSTSTDEASASAFASWRLGPPTATSSLRSKSDLDSECSRVQSICGDSVA